MLIFVYMLNTPSIPLAERLRPKNLDEFLGQSHLVGNNGPIRKCVETGSIPSMIFWGPPGVGKTTLAQLISQETKRPFYTLSAINSGVKDIRAIITNYAIIHAGINLTICNSQA